MLGMYVFTIPAAFSYIQLFIQEYTVAYMRWRDFCSKEGVERKEDLL